MTKPVAATKVNPAPPSSNACDVVFQCEQIFRSELCGKSRYYDGYTDEVESRFADLLKKTQVRSFMNAARDYEYLSLSASHPKVDPPVHEDSIHDFTWLFFTNHSLSEIELQQVKNEFVHIWNARIKDSAWKLSPEQVVVTNGPKRKSAKELLPRTEYFSPVNDDNSPTVQVEVIPPGCSPRS